MPYKDIRQAPYDLAKVANALKAAGRGDLRRQLLARIRVAGKPAVKAAQERALATMPKSGGLADLVASNLAVRSNLSGASASVRIRRKGKTPTDRTMVGMDEAGTWRHPVYGDRTKWVEQSAPASINWFTGTIDQHAPVFRDAVLAAMEDIAAKIRKAV